MNEPNLASAGCAGSQNTHSGERARLKGPLAFDSNQTPRDAAGHLIYWDADDSRELLDATHIDKYTGGSLTRLFTASGVSSNNGSKSTPALTADLFGDWREEVIWREADSSALRLYTTTSLTSRRIYTLMHDPQYRMQVSSENTAYNQPPHPGFHIGTGMAAPPKPDILVK